MQFYQDVNSLITFQEPESIIVNIHIRKTSPNGHKVEFYQTLLSVQLEYQDTLKIF